MHYQIFIKNWQFFALEHVTLLDAYLQLDQTTELHEVSVVH